MTVYIATGLGYGDEGKGGTVDFLARQGSAVVVRHNGGPQAGHNVVTDDGRHHTFSQFGSGTFAGAATFLSEHMLINPLNMEFEAEHLMCLGETDIWDRIYVDLGAKIITPYHVEANRNEEIARGDGRHGSCGQGVGLAMRQNLERPDLTIYVSDLADSGLESKLSALKAYLLPTVTDPWFWNSGSLASRYQQWVLNVHAGFAKEFPFGDTDHVIFEGAQGVLLDEWHGFHPYTTWSTTTHDNAVDFLWDIDLRHEPVVKLGVTRAYMTRHGPGPFVTEDPQLKYAEPHNSTGQWQGAFRQGHLDFVALRYAIACCGGVDQLVVTHLDRAEKWKYADSYDYVLRDIARRDNRDLKYQEFLGRALPRMRPIINEPVATGTLLALLGELAPVGLTSHGPTASEKSLLDLKVA